MTSYPEDLSYFQNREREAMRLAKTAKDVAIRKIHERMAQNYRELLEELEARREMPALKVVRDA